MSGSPREERVLSRTVSSERAASERAGFDLSVNAEGVPVVDSTPALSDVFEDRRGERLLSRA